MIARVAQTLRLLHKGRPYQQQGKSRARPWIPISTASSDCRPMSSPKSTRCERPRERKGAISSTSAWATPDLPPPQHVIDKLLRGGPEPRCARLFAVEGHPRPAQGSGELLRAPLRRRAGPRKRSGGHAWLEGRPRQPRHPRSPRRATQSLPPTRAIRSTPSASSSPGPRSARCRPRPTIAIGTSWKRR